MTESALTPIPVAFLGGAINSAVGRVHRTAIEMDRRFVLQAGCFSRHADVNRATAAVYGIAPERTYDDLDALLQNEAGRVAAIIILTPTDQHRDHVLAALAAGFPVICEKALALSSAEIAAIRRRLSEKDGFLAVTYNYTGYPMLRELRDMIARQRFGTLEQIHIEMPQEGFARLTKEGGPVVPQDWRLRDVTVPTVSLDLGVHTHSLVQFLTGKRPLELSAMSNRYGNFTQIIDSVSCLASYEGNLAVTMWYGKAALGYRNGLKIRLFGSTGAAEWLQENPEILQMADNLGRRAILDRASPDAQIANAARYTRFKAGHPAGFIEAFANYYHDVADALQHYLAAGAGNNPLVLGANESFEGLRMFEAVALSSAERRWVAVAG